MLAILRHIFFAIIVDTFGELREDKFERDQHANNSCFICGVDRHDFDRIVVTGNNGGFAYHRSVVHNTLHYVYYVIAIWQLPEQDDNGIEMHVRRSLRNRDISWFPMGISHASSKHGHGHGHASNAPTTGNELTMITNRGNDNSSRGPSHGGHDHSNDHDNSKSDGNHNNAEKTNSQASSSRKGAHSEGRHDSGKVGGSDIEMVSHILHIEKQLSRMMGGSVGDSTKLRSDSLNSIHEGENEDEDHEQQPKAAPVLGTGIDQGSQRNVVKPRSLPAMILPTTTSSTSSTTSTTTTKQPLGESPLLTTATGKHIPPALLNILLQTPTQPQISSTEGHSPRSQSPVLLFQQQHQQQQQPKIQEQSGQVAVQQPQTLSATNSQSSELIISSTSSTEQFQSISTMSNKISDIGSMLRLVMNKLDNLEVQNSSNNNSSSSSRSKKSSKRTSTSRSGKVEGGGGGSMVSMASGEESEESSSAAKPLRGPSSSLAASVSQQGVSSPTISSIPHAKQA